MNKKISRICLLIVSSIFLLLAAACSNAATKSSGTEEGKSEKTIKVKMGLDTAAGGSLQIRVAKENGYFEKYGIDADVSNFAYGIDTINALLINRTETGIAADYALLNALGKGDMTIVSTLTRANEETSKETQLLVKGNINGPKDLKGKHLGVAKGTVYEYVWAKYLEKNNISESDITYVPYSTPDEAIVGMQKGDIDAVWIGGALTDKFKSVAGAKEIADVSDSGVQVDSYLIMQRSFVEKNPDTVRDILKAINEGIQYVNTHHEETADIAFKQLKLPKEDVVKDLNRTNYVLGFTKEDGEHLEDMKLWLEQKGILKEKFELKDKISVEPLKKALPESVTYEK